MLKQKQLEMFAAPEPTKDDKLNAELAAMRLDQMARDATKPGRRPHRHRYRARRVDSRCVLTCPSCKSSLTLTVVS